MDTELARTFLAVIETGSFVAAADRLHLTQSAVSARIRRLEEWTGSELFVRERNGCVVTDAGRRFQPHALLLTRLVEQTRRAMRESTSLRATLTIGGRPGLWEHFLSRWLGEFALHAPHTAIRALVGHEQRIMQALREGDADAGILYAPEPQPGIAIETLFEERLVMIRSGAVPSPGNNPCNLHSDYVHVDWGPQFRNWHARAFPDFAGAGLAVDAGWLGLQHVITQGGCGYFPLRLLHDPLQAGLVHRVPDAPEFPMPVYLCHPTPVESAPLASALASIRRVSHAIDGIDT